MTADADIVISCHLAVKAEGSCTNLTQLFNHYLFSPVGEVGRAWMYCNTKTTRDKTEASFCASPDSKNQINIIVAHCATNQILN